MCYFGCSQNLCKPLCFICFQKCFDISTWYIRTILNMNFYITVASLLIQNNNRNFLIYWFVLYAAHNTDIYICFLEFAPALQMENKKLFWFAPFFKYYVFKLISYQWLNPNQCFHFVSFQLLIPSMIFISKQCFPLCLFFPAAKSSTCLSAGEFQCDSLPFTPMIWSLIRLP